VDAKVDARLVRWVRRAAVVILVLGVGACVSESADGPADPELLPPGETSATSEGTEDAVPPPPADGVPATAVPAAGSRSALAGYGEVLVEVERADGSVVQWCLLLAETPAQRQRGLMAVTDPALGGYDGMLFRFEAPNEGAFYMRNTPQPLSIAYLDGAGATVSVQEMAPCADETGCPSYPAGAPYQRTVEVPVSNGGVAALGIDDDSRLEDLGTRCPPP
jgi:uncharacterized membrane protein (UPF0127 family)